MDAEGGRIDFMFLGPSPTRPLDPLLVICLTNVVLIMYTAELKRLLKCFVCFFFSFSEF